MQEIRKHLECERPFDELLEDFLGEVFHVTKEQNWPNILSSNEVTPNPKEGEYDTTFGTTSYFRSKDCVCLFDYRNFYEESAQKFYGRCLPTSSLSDDCPIRIVFLRKNYYSDLISWREWEKDGAGTNVVPYIEAGFKGAIPLNYFYKSMVVTITEDKNSIAYILKKAQRGNKNG